VCLFELERQLNTDLITVPLPKFFFAVQTLTFGPKWTTILLLKTFSQRW